MSTLTTVKHFKLKHIFYISATTSGSATTPTGLLAPFTLTLMAVAQTLINSGLWLLLKCKTNVPTLKHNMIQLHQCHPVKLFIVNSGRNVMGRHNFKNKPLKLSNFLSLYSMFSGRTHLFRNLDTEFAGVLVQDRGQGYFFLMNCSSLLSFLRHHDL